MYPLTGNNKNNLRSVRNVSPRAVLNFKQKLSQIDWLKLGTFSHVEEAYDYFNILLTNSLNECCRIKKVKLRTTYRPTIKPFIPELKKYNDFVTVFFNKYKNSRGKSNENSCRQEYLHAKRVNINQLNYAKKVANEQYITKSTNKYKAAWNLIKMETNCKTRNCEPLIDSCTFNSYFVNIVKELNLCNNNNESISPAIELVNNFVVNHNTS